MGKTIIQTIGPLYGEVENGTVFGRPNGSIYTPAVNTIELTTPAGQEYIKVADSRVVFTNSSGSNVSYYKVVAESQDTASYMETSIEDTDGNVIGTGRSNSAGLFNLSFYVVGYATADQIEQGTEYKAVATLYSASGVALATSKITVHGVVVE